MNLPESQLYQPIADWLKAQGYSKIFAEAWGHDIAAIRESDGHTICIEMKTTCSQKLFKQVCRAGSYFDAVYGAVPKMPRAKTLESWKRMGMGLLLVFETTSVVLEPECKAWEPTRDRMAEALRRWTPDPTRIGGVPCLAGDGGAQRVCRAITEYKASNPAATWRDIFRDVPNHYSSFRSMQGAMRMLAERTHWKEARKKNLAAAQGLAARFVG